jgi:hypothetical protein
VAISQKEHTPVEFFAEGYRLSGSFDARRASLGDALYDATSEFVVLREAYISVIDRPAEILTNYPVALVTKWSVAFALTTDQDLALRHDQKFSPYQRPKTRHLHVIVPFFEVTGDLRMPGHVDPRLMFKSQKESFVTLLDVTARSTSDPSVSYQGGAALVNTSKISFVGLQSL